ncbi:MAG TPA: hydroxymethylbilane synthase [Bifidobacterium sp.]|nr:hydroxymethylbilane synthase [Bifidobacterium sp.]HAK72280.1 hydroxymethylbilane synthase [Bifidobacterium sp.]HCH22540.1 hydroxymethylbilane synthase [Bifidobacterium sp.]
MGFDESGVTVMTCVAVGTRGSALARCQTGLVLDALRRSLPGVDVPEFDIRVISTQGDRQLNASLQAIGGKGVFVKEIESELLNGQIDIAVHSLKDMAPELPEGLTVGAILARACPFDCLISVHAGGAAPLDSLPKGARVGTNSLRRQSQLLHLRPDLRIVPIRGNVPTRIRAIERYGLDAVVLAQSGLRRLDFTPESLMSEYGLHWIALDETMLPAAGQGAMAVECRADDAATLRMLAYVDDASTRRDVTVERAFMQALGGSCTFPIGAYGRGTDEGFAFDGFISQPDGTQWRGCSFTAAGSDVPALVAEAEQYAGRLLQDGEPQVVGTAKS